MKVATHKLITQIPSPVSPQNSLSQLSSADVSGICQIIMQQLASLLPTVAIWTVYQNLETQKRQLVSYVVSDSADCTPSSETSCIDFAYLQQEEWLQTNLSVLTITELSMTAAYHAYVCCVGEQSALTAEYMFICTGKTLSLAQQQLLLANAQMLSHYLLMYKERSRHLATIAALSQALGRIEHQLRNPLALINLYAENLRLALPEDCLREQAELIRRTVDELSVKLKDLLCLGQKARLQIQQHNLRKIVIDSIKALQPLLQQKKIQIHYPDKPVHVSVDSWQMKQVFDNLFTNAVHFSPEGETVICNWYSYHHEILVEICDRGCGIPASDLKQIFTPYYSRRLGGTGLGLAIAQKIILDHQGNLWAENIPGGGAQFSFTLPINKC